MLTILRLFQALQHRRLVPTFSASMDVSGENGKITVAFLVDSVQALSFDVIENGVQSARDGQNARDDARDGRAELRLLTHARSVHSLCSLNLLCSAGFVLVNFAVS